ncbi:MAG: DUF481 domain-containing protein [Bacteroidota bacterium]
MKKFLFSFLLLLPIGIAAQINQSDTLNFKANLAVTGFWQGGNVETIIFRIKSDLSWRPSRTSVFKTSNSYVYQEFGRVKADSDILSLNFLYFNPERKIYPLLLGFVSTSFRREIDLRYLLGAGLSFQLIKHKKNWLNCSVTGEYEKTNFASTNFNREAYNGSEVINTIRGTLWINGKYYLFKDKMIFSHESYFQPSLVENDNFRWQLDLGLEFPIWKFLNFKISHRSTYESIVVTNQQQSDQILSFGFSATTVQ